jgi:hypothetical protein
MPLTWTEEKITQQWQQQQEEGDEEVEDADGWCSACACQMWLWRCTSGELHHWCADC